jgi:hypothetical protein
VAAAEPAVVTAPEVAAEEVVDAVYEDEASASNISADADELIPVPPEFAVPPMEWLLGGPSAGWLVDDPERDFGDEELLAPPPPPASPQTMYYCMRHNFGPCLPSPTPSDEDMQHFAPPGYEPVPVPEFSSSSAAALVDAHPPLVKKKEVVAAAPARAPRALPDLDLPAPVMEEEKNEDEAPSLALLTPSSEARVLLRRLASTMAARPNGIRAGTWAPEALGLTGAVEFRLDEATTRRPSSSMEGPAAADGTARGHRHGAGEQW